MTMICLNLYCSSIRLGLLKLDSPVLKDMGGKGRGLGDISNDDTCHKTFHQLSLLGNLVIHNVYSYPPLH